MYTRITTFKVDPARMSELPAKIKQMQPSAKTLPGIIDVYVSWRSDGHGVVTSVYDSKTSADTATAQIQAIWGGLGDLLAGAPTTEAYDTVEQLVG